MSTLINIYSRMLHRLCGVALVLAFLALVQESSAQVREDKLELLFGQDSYEVDPTLGDNEKILERLTTLFDKITTDTLTTIRQVEINSWSSPEPGDRYNKTLTERRSQAIKNYITERWEIPDSMIQANGNGVAWSKLREMVANSEMDHRDEVLDVIDNTPVETWRRINPSDRWLTLADSRVNTLMHLRGGKPYKHLYTNYFPALRYGSQISLFQSFPEPISPTHTQISTVKPVERIYIANIAPEKSESPISPTEQSKSYPFAIKTNLLFDCILAPNIELEIPIGDRWSVAAEWVFPWWTWDDGTANSSRNRMQLLNGNLEGKYWLGDRTTQAQLTGWYAGLYAGGGLYDFERNAKGYQGEFFIAAGLEGGYAHTINKSGSLRMEYSLGIGYLKTDYRYYEAIYDVDEQWHPVRQSNGVYTWFGPTRARISLVWYLNGKSKK